MWLCTTLGFYSIVRKNPRELHVRARSRQDLLNLRAHCYGRVGGPGEVDAWKIHKTEPADYRYRIVVDPKRLPEIMAALAETLDYANFKGVIASTEDQRDKLAVYSAFHQDLEHWQSKLAR